MGYGWRVAYKCSLMNKPQGGGSDKAGLPSSVGRESYTSVLMNGRRDGALNLVNLRKNRFKVNANQNLPLGFNHNIRMY